MSDYTLRLIMVAKPGVAAFLNAAAQEADPEGGAPFDIALALPATPTAPVAYWCSWQMVPAQGGRLRQKMRDRGATVAETAVFQAGEVPPVWPGVSRRLWVFDGNDWAPGEVLSALGLVRAETLGV